jgi:hypothetical protein
MFDWFRNKLSRPPAEKYDDLQLVSEWAGLQGFSVQAPSSAGRSVADGFTLGGKVRGTPWKLVLGAASRDYVHGKELRARAELGLDPSVEVLVTNRPLHDVLAAERKQIDCRATGIPCAEHAPQAAQREAQLRDPRYIEEMRWMTQMPEVCWDSLPAEFWTRYCVKATQRQHALALIDPNLAELMLDWPSPATTQDIPMTLMLLRGKAYMRMQYTPAETSTLQHAAIVFTSACDSALGSFSSNP